MPLPFLLALGTALGTRALLQGQEDTRQSEQAQKFSDMMGGIFAGAENTNFGPQPPGAPQYNQGLLAQGLMRNPATAQMGNQQMLQMFGDQGAMERLRAQQVAGMGAGTGMPEIKAPPGEYMAMGPSGPELVATPGSPRFVKAQDDYGALNAAIDLAERGTELSREGGVTGLWGSKKGEANLNHMLLLGSVGKLTESNMLSPKVVEMMSKSLASPADMDITGATLKAHQALRSELAAKRFELEKQYGRWPGFLSGSRGALGSGQALPGMRDTGRTTP